ncbi:MAG: DUF4856 domain-containing protein, partial [Candidatus Kapaibacterium sp.]
MKKMILLLSVLSLLLISCSDDKIVEPDPDPEPKTYVIPETYNFDNVDYSRQLVLIEMLEEMKSFITDAIINKAAVRAGTLNKMFLNTGTPFVNPNLNASEESLYIETNELRTSFFEFYFADINNASTTREAANNKKGILVTKDKSQTFLVDSVGKEYLLMIEKGLMGALFYYQVAQVYTSDDKIGANVDNKTVVTGQGTEMQHNWDQAFGYFGATLDFPESNTGLKYVAKLSDELNELLNTNHLLMKEGFLKGRAAINNDDSKGKNEAVASIRKNWELVLAATAVHHLKEAKENFDDTALKHHYLTAA